MDGAQPAAAADSGQGSSSMPKKTHSRRPRSQRGQRAAADAMVLAKYVQHVLRQRESVRRSSAAAGAWYARWREARRGAAAAGRAAERLREAGRERQQVAQASELPRNAQRTHFTAQVHSSSSPNERAAAAIQNEYSAWVATADPRLLGSLRAKNTGTRRRVTAATGNGRRVPLRQGVNVTTALQRNEAFGRSWRGSREGG